MLPRILLLPVSFSLFFWASANGQENVKGLFLGDRGAHQPMRRFLELQPVLAERGIELHYTERTSDLNNERLSQFDVVVLYANIDELDDDQAQSLLNFRRAGRGFCAAALRDLLLSQPTPNGGADGGPVSAARYGRFSNRVGRS
jgi:hypothetical protein